MVKHYNPSIVQDAQRILNTKMDNLSDNVADMVAIIPIEPVCRIAKSAQRASSGATTLYTTPVDKDFYLIGCYMTMVKDVTCDVASTDGPTLKVNIDGVSSTLLQLATLTLTAQQSQISINFRYPIKCDRNAAITLTGGTFAAGTLVKTGGIFGYTQETTAT